MGPPLFCAAHAPSGTNSLGSPRIASARIRLGRTGGTSQGRGPAPGAGWSRTGDFRSGARVCSVNWQRVGPRHWPFPILSSHPSVTFMRRRTLAALYLRLAARRPSPLRSRCEPHPEATSRRVFQPDARVCTSRYPRDSRFFERFAPVAGRRSRGAAVSRRREMAGDSWHDVPKEGEVRACAS